MSPSFRPTALALSLAVAFPLHALAQADTSTAPAREARDALEVLPPVVITAPIMQTPLVTQFNPRGRFTGDRGPNVILDLAPSIGLAGALPADRILQRACRFLEAGDLQAGSKVNLEVDLIARYVERMLGAEGKLGA